MSEESEWGGSDSLLRVVCFVIDEPGLGGATLLFKERV